MNNKSRRAGKAITSLLLCFALSVFSASSAALAAKQGAGQLRVPVVIELSYAIAGVEINFQHTDGLEFIAFEKSKAVESAASTPTVRQNGNTQVGFLAGDNHFVPENGKLNIGYLEFESTGDPDRSVTLNEIELIRVVSDGRTESEFIILIDELPIPLSGALGIIAGSEEDMMMRLMLCGAFLVACTIIYGVLTIKKPRST